MMKKIKLHLHKYFFYDIFAIGIFILINIVFIKFIHDSNHAFLMPCRIWRRRMHFLFHAKCVLCSRSPSGNDGQLPVRDRCQPPKITIRFSIRFHNKLPARYRMTTHNACFPICMNASASEYFPK